MSLKIVAEMSASHLGSLGRAMMIVKAAAAAGADCIKFQTYQPEQMVSADLQITKGPWAGLNALELYREAHTPREWHPHLFRMAMDLGLTPFSSVFHRDDVDFLETLDCPIYKIASFEATDLALIKYAAETGKPLVISTGMCTEAEIRQACLVADRSRHLTLLKCTSAYPATPADANLAAMQQLKAFPRCTAFGLSDHTDGIGVAVAAVALGASMIEKHLTLRRSEGGPDAAFSMEPEEFRQMVTECRRAEQAIGTVRYGPLEAEAPSMELRRSTGGRRGQ